MVSPPSWTTSRLVYRAVDPKDKDWIISLYNNPVTAHQSMASIPQPYSAKESEKTLEWSSKCLLSIIACLPKSPEEPNVPGVPVLWVQLHPKPPHMQHHRSATFGLTVHHDYQGKGYGPEALEWLLEQAFQRAGLHRVEGEVFGWNKAALSVYNKVGFKQEGIKRESMFQDGEFQDEIIMGILEQEWRERRKAKSAQA